MEERIRIEQGGLQCDNPECDWSDMTIVFADYPQYINAPCPKCDENILTEEDHNLVVELRKMVTMFNNMTEEEMKAFEDAQTEESLQENKKMLKEQYNIDVDELSHGDELKTEFSAHKKLSVKSIKKV